MTDTIYNSGTQVVGYRAIRARQHHIRQVSLINRV